MLYRTQQVQIKKGHRLYDYLESMTLASKNLYNTSNYYIRQLFTGLRKEHLSRNEIDAIAYINNHVALLNEVRLEKYLRQKKTKPFVEFECVSKDMHLTYELLDGIFKVTKHPDYYALPGQVNQQVIKNVFRNWKSYFKAVVDYRSHPEKYKSVPKIPKYKKNSKNLIILSNQVCVLKGTYLKFPKTKQTLNIGKYFSQKGRLKEVRVLPKYDTITLELVFTVEKEEHVNTKENVASIDMGVNNLVTMVNNVGERPIIVKGTVVKSINQYYNKMRSSYYSQLRGGKKFTQGSFTSKRLRKLDEKRYLKIKDYFHKTSYKIVENCLSMDCGTLVIGLNKGYKQDVKMRKADKQNFIHIPFGMLITMISYKAEAAGINIIINEESYTSKASFLDGDDMPVYGEAVETAFSGKRISRGRYRSKHGVIINADVNAALNIMKKAVPEAVNALWDRGVGSMAVMSTPLVLKVA